MAYLFIVSITFTGWNHADRIYSTSFDHIRGPSSLFLHPANTFGCNNLANSKSICAWAWEISIDGLKPHNFFQSILEDREIAFKDLFASGESGAKAKKSKNMHRRSKNKQQISKKTFVFASTFARCIWALKSQKFTGTQQLFIRRSFVSNTSLLWTNICDMWRNGTVCRYISQCKPMGSRTESS